MVLLTFFLLCVSDADMKTATSRMPAAMRRVEPLLVGHQRRVDDARLARDAPRDLAASASCGIHFGLTKLVISMARSPVRTARR